MSAMRRPLLLVLPCIVGCSDLLARLDTTPARLELDAPSEALLDTAPRPISARVLTRSGKLLPDASAQLSWSAIPTNIAEATDGHVRCVASGDASVLVAGAGVSATFTVKCRVVASLAMPEKLQLLLGEPGVALRVMALDADRITLFGVDPTLRSSDPSVFDMREGAAFALSVGTANLVAEAGAVRQEVPVRVIERTTTDTLVLADGAHQTYTLTRGNYLVEVNVRADDGSGYGVTVADVGGGCPNQGEATLHRFECAVSDTTSLVVTNPTGWGWGPGATGNLTIYRIP
jgi:hypothetical protein